MTYANGVLPASVLAYIPGTFKQLLAQLIPQTDALRSAFAAYFGKPLLITDAYRDLATQVTLKITKGDYAATPGTSNHGWGRAIDFGSNVNVDGSPEHLWMVANAPAYGWTHPAWAADWNPANGQHEPWHWEASVYAVNYPRAVVPTVIDVPTVTPPTPVQEDDMFSDTDRALLQNVENLLARGSESGSGIRGDVLAVKADVTSTRADVGTVANELRALRSVTDAIDARDASAIVAAIPTDIARQVADLLAARLAS